MYFLWANLEVLNQIRKAKGLNTIAFRPHAGETGNPMHLGASYMLCQSINHGVNLDMQVSLQYLYYLDQVRMRVKSGDCIMGGEKNYKTCASVTSKKKKSLMATFLVFCVFT